MLDDLKDYPQSEELDISALCRLFEDTTNSYKCIIYIFAGYSKKAII